MKRHLCATALMALALIPDWAGACWPPGSGPQPVYYAPAYYHCPPIYYYPPPCIPTAPPVLIAPPRIEPAKDKGGTRIEPARPIAKPDPAPAPKPADPVRPIGGTDAKPPVPAPVPAAPPKVDVIPSPAVPIPAPPQDVPAPKAEPKREPRIEIPNPVTEPKLPPLELPKTDEPKLPPLELPKTEPAAAPKLPPIELPKIDAPKLPDLPGGAAVPSAAPAPDALIPPPNIPNGPGALPPLTLPPDTPVAPEKDAKAKPVEARSSPLAARELKVSVFPAAGTSAATGLRRVGFYNHTARDLSLTIDGKVTTLPAMSYVHAQVPASFTWKCGDRPAAKETVPADAAGVDVLIRD